MPTDSRTLRFIFLNTYLMNIKADNIIGGKTKGTKPRVSARAREIGSYLRTHADIAALAEVWTDTEKNLVLRQWPQKPPHVHRITKFVAADSVGNAARRESKRKGSSGLMVISPGLDRPGREFKEYRNETGVDKKADKGVLKATIDVGMGPSKLAVFCTHLQAGDRLTALRQVVQLATFVSERRSKQDPSIICGDFNIDALSARVRYSTDDVLKVKFRVPEKIRRAVRESRGRHVESKTGYEMLCDVLAAVGFRDLWGRNIRYGWLGLTSDVAKARGDEPICAPDRRDPRFCDERAPGLNANQGKRIDYIFTSPASRGSSFTMRLSTPRRLRLLRDRRAPGFGEIAFLSDHIGLFTELRLKRRG